MFVGLTVIKYSFDILPRDWKILLIPSAMELHIYIIILKLIVCYSFYIQFELRIEEKFDIKINLRLLNIS